MSKMSALKRTAVYLFRNDLRVHDNECLLWAHRNCDFIIPLYCIDPKQFKHGTYHFNFHKTGVHRSKFLLETIADLRSELKKRGSNLIVRSKGPVDAIAEIIELCKSSEAPVRTLVYQEEITEEELNVESSLTKLCRDQSIQVQTFWGLSLFHRDDIPYSRESIPDTFTKFRQGVEARSSVRPVFTTPSRIKTLPPVKSAKLGDIPTLVELGFPGDFSQDERTAFPFLGGESAGLARLEDYSFGTDALATYKETRNGLLGTDYSTKFSPWLANGSLSPRMVYEKVKLYEDKKVSNQSTYWSIFELIWRDYFKFVCWKYGNKVFHLSGIMGKHLPWKQDMITFKKWCDGRTGVPFVDANMREMLSTGWMSNRGRQNVASFLVKDLGLDWRLGAEWFESLLVDHDVCSNYGNWNYAAGIGNDPRQDRKFNMIKQGLDYDPTGEYVTTWVPELKDLPQSKRHIPWTMNIMEQQSSGFSLGDQYPNPIVIAPEWGRHVHKTNAKSFNKTSAKSQRGIDFYFKSNGSKDSRGHRKR